MLSSILIYLREYRSNYIYAGVKFNKDLFTQIKLIENRILIEYIFQLIKEFPSL